MEFALRRLGFEQGQLDLRWIRRIEYEPLEIKIVRGTH